VIRLIPGKLYQVVEDRIYLKEFPVFFYLTKLKAAKDGYDIIGSSFHDGNLIVLNTGDVFMYVGFDENHHVFLYRGKTYWKEPMDQEHLGNLLKYCIRQI
jgi:hypothetical protein